MHCDEVLTDFVSAHLPVQKLVLYNPRPSDLTDFCTYASIKEMVCVSARTSITAALMSMAMASILKVFLMRKKEYKGYSAEQRRRGREVGQR